MIGPSELFDEVDENDVPTGRKITKKQAHQEGCLHRCVAVFVFDEKGKLYVQEHKATGLFDHSVGGHVSAGEEYLPAAIREAEEELGLKNQKLTFIDKSVRSIEFYPASHIRHMFGIYSCYPQNWQFKSNDEVETIYPDSLESIIMQMNDQGEKFTSGFINTMAKYVEKRQLPYKLDMQNIRAKWAREERI